MEARGPAYVTGASRGIGRAVALELAQRGFDVVAAMRNPADGASLATEGAGRITLDALDVDRPKTISLPEGLRVLVNNAGLDAQNEPVEHATLDEWRRVFETNVFGLVEVTRRAVPRLRAAGGGVVCNLSSASLLFPMPFYAIYRASKAAVSALGESLAAELAPFGIRVVEVMPGPVRTDMLAESAKPPEGAEHPAYAALARWAHESRAGMAGRETAAAEAARAIVDTILDDESPLRVGCDPVGAAMIAGAEAAPHEARMRGALAAMAAACRDPED